MDKLTAWIKNWLATSTQKQKLTAALVVLGVLSTVGLMVMTGASSTSIDPLETSPFYFVSVFIKLIIVLLLIVGSSIIFRRWMQPGMSGKQKRQVQLLETVRLSPKQALHLISVGDRHLLIGATDQGISLLDQVELDLEELGQKDAAFPPAPEFGSVLRNFDLGSQDSLSK